MTRSVVGFADTPRVILSDLNVARVVAKDRAAPSPVGDARYALLV